MDAELIRRAQRGDEEAFASLAAAIGGRGLRLLPLDDSTLDGGLAKVADRDQLERGFRLISIDHCAVVVLHHYLDKPLDEVARILDIPVGTAHSDHRSRREARAARL